MIPELFKRAIAEVESTDDYSKVNEIGALGRYQFLPSMAKELLGEAFDADSFISSPELQDATLEKYWEHYLERGGDPNNFRQYATFHFAGKLEHKAIADNKAIGSVANYINKADSMREMLAPEFGGSGMIGQIRSKLEKDIYIPPDFSAQLKDPQARKAFMEYAKEQGLIEDTDEAEYRVANDLGMKPELPFTKVAKYKVKDAIAGLKDMPLGPIGVPAEVYTGKPMKEREYEPFGVGETPIFSRESMARTVMEYEALAENPIDFSIGLGVSTLYHAGAGALKGAAGITSVADAAAGIVAEIPFASNFMNNVREVTTQRIMNEFAGAAADLDLQLMGDRLQLKGIQIPGREDLSVRTSHGLMLDMVEALTVASLTAKFYSLLGPAGFVAAGGIRGAYGALQGEQAEFFGLDVPMPLERWKWPNAAWGAVVGASESRMLQGVLRGSSMYLPRQAGAVATGTAFAAPQMIGKLLGKEVSGRDVIESFLTGYILHNIGYKGYYEKAKQFNMLMGNAKNEWIADQMRINPKIAKPDLDIAWNEMVKGLKEGKYDDPAVVASILATAKGANELGAAASLEAGKDGVKKIGFVPKSNTGEVIKPGTQLELFKEQLNLFPVSAEVKAEQAARQKALTTAKPIAAKPAPLESRNVKARDYWDNHLEHNSIRANPDTDASALVSYQLEAAGDILRELGKSYADMGYITEKVNRIKNNLNDRSWSAQMTNISDKRLVDIKSNIKNIPETSSEIILVKKVLSDIASRDVVKLRKDITTLDAALQAMPKDIYGSIDVLTRAPKGTQAEPPDKFKSWFGKSKVVDEGGNPIPVYHGSPSRDITEFRLDAPKNFNVKGDIEGIYFSGDPHYAYNYAKKKLPIGTRRPIGEKGKVYKAFLHIENPLDITSDILLNKRRPAGKRLTFGDAKRKALEKYDATKHDGIIFKGDGTNPAEYIVFSHEQIKLFTPGQPGISPSMKPGTQAELFTAEQIGVKPGQLSLSQEPAKLPPPAPPLMTIPATAPDVEDAAELAGWLKVSGEAATAARRTSGKSKLETFITYTYDSAGGVKRRLRKVKDPMADAAIRAKDLALGTSPAASSYVNEFDREMSSLLRMIKKSPLMKDANIRQVVDAAGGVDKFLNSYIIARRVIAIRNTGKDWTPPGDPAERNAFVKAITAKSNEFGNVFNDYIKISGIASPELTTSRRAYFEKARSRTHTIKEAEGMWNDFQFNRYNNLMKTVAANPDLYSLVDGAATNYHESLKQSTIGLLLRDGIISQADYEHLSNIDLYTPIEWVDYIDPTVGYIGKGSNRLSVRNSGIRPLEQGSLGYIETDVRATAHEAIRRTVGTVMRGRASKSAFDLAVAKPDNGVFKTSEITGTDKYGHPTFAETPAGWVELFTVSDGVKHKFLVNKDIADEWLHLEPVMDSKVSQQLQLWLGSKWLKAGATGYNPYYAARNLPRDMAYIWHFTDAYNPLLPIGLAQMSWDMLKTLPEAAGVHPISGTKELFKGGDFAKVWRATFNRDGLYKDYTRTGGGMEFMYKQGRFAGVESQTITDVLNAMGYLNEMTEIWSRLALTQRCLDKGMSMNEAVHIGRTYLDFGQSGKLPLVMEPMFPYFRAGVQATRGAARYAKTHPAKFALKTAQLMGMAWMLYDANSENKECFDSIPSDIKEAYWCLTTPLWTHDEKGNVAHLYYTVAKDQSQRLMCTLADAWQAKSRGDAYDWDIAKRAAFDMIGIVQPENISPTFKAILGYSLNKDFWSREDIWRGPDVSPELQFLSKAERPWQPTPEVYKKVGEATGASPVKVEYGVNQFFPKNNPYYQMVGTGIRKMMDDLKPTEREEAMAKLVSPLLAKAGLARLATVATVKYSVRDEAVRESYDKKIVIDRGLTEVASNYTKVDKAGTAPSDVEAALNNVTEYIKNQNPLEQPRLVRRFANEVILNKLGFTVGEKQYWLGLSDEPDEARAKAYYMEELRLSEQLNSGDKFLVEEANKSIDRMQLVLALQGFKTTKFLYYLSSLRASHSQGNQ